ncbi:MAG: hypothetical protein LBU67_09565 [Oscillospiraceae bacterium]|jgi:hypothetical protein|nr:hypothetical protein [Oscillospiraceae bacterium]
MNLQEIKERAVRQFGLDTQDAAELNCDLDDYINEGYDQALRARYKPWREEAHAVKDGGVAFGALRHRPVRVLLAIRGGAKAEVLLDEQAARINLPGVPDGVAVTLRYGFVPAPLREAEDVPLLPEWTHGALADWATWRLYATGSAQRQSRGLVFRAAYEQTFARLRPYGAEILGLGSFRNLYAVRSAL